MGPSEQSAQRAQRGAGPVSFTCSRLGRRGTGTLTDRARREGPCQAGPAAAPGCVSSSDLRVVSPRLPAWPAPPSCPSCPAAVSLLPWETGVQSAPSAKEGRGHAKPVMGRPPRPQHRLCPVGGSHGNPEVLLLPGPLQPPPSAGPPHSLPVKGRRWRGGHCPCLARAATPTLCCPLGW